MNIQTQISELINLVPYNDLPTILEVVKHFIPEDTDDFFTVDDFAAHEAALQDLKNGEIVSHENIAWKE